MNNYKKGRKRFKVDRLGSLYIEEKWNSDIPTIFIGGQMEHRRHILEQTGLTPEAGYTMFDGCWFYDYPVTTKDKSKYNAENFANNLLALLKEANIKKVNLMTESYGGSIGAYASKEEIVNKVVAVHPPILGTPLASEDLLNFKNLLTSRQKWIARLISLFINSNYGFQQDNAHLIDLKKVDLNKLLVVGSTLDIEKEPFYFKELYDMILKITGFESDGIVPYDPDTFARFGINYVTEQKSLNHSDASKKENIEEAYRLTLK